MRKVLIALVLAVASLTPAPAQAAPADNKCRETVYKPVLYRAEADPRVRMRLKVNWSCDYTPRWILVSHQPQYMPPDETTYFNWGDPKRDTVPKRSGTLVIEMFCHTGRWRSLVDLTNELGTDRVYGLPLITDCYLP